jgi:hypothetical protein
MNVAFLYPWIDERDALKIWVETLARYCTTHDVALVRTAERAAQGDVIFCLTESGIYPRGAIDNDVSHLRDNCRMVAFVHNNETGVPSCRDDVPSFCWTKTAQRRLASYSPMLLRQPVLPFLADMPPAPKELHVGTFGARIEPKKRTREMALWAKKECVRFSAFGEEWTTAAAHSVYCRGVKKTGASVFLYHWKETVEDLAYLFGDVSHLLFVLPPSKGGTGGSPTCPRYATAFGRPVIVVDDEGTFVQDKFFVYERLEDVQKWMLGEMCPPSTSWSPDAYVSELVQRTLAYYSDEVNL